MSKNNFDKCIRIGTPSVKPLITALEGTDNYTREKAAEALGTIGDPKAIKPLTRALRDSDKSLLLAASNSLEQIDNNIWTSNNGVNLTSK